VIPADLGSLVVEEIVAAEVTRWTSQSSQPDNTYSEEHMGLYERDYMRERHRRSLRRDTGKSSSASSVSWKNAGLTILLLAVGAYVVVRWSDQGHVVPFPATGAVIWYTAHTGSGAPLTIAAPADSTRNHVVQLGDWASGKVVATVPIRAGETAQLEVPLGQYSITIASGDRWYGPEKLFGPAGETRKALAAMHFYRSGQQTMGHRIDLAKRVNGNLETRPVGPFDR
jgi:hypothetical protein